MINGAKLALLIPRLASEFEGEVVNTVHAIRRLLKADGHDLHDLARIVAGGSLESKKGWSEPHRPEQGETAIITVAEHLLKSCSWLNDWERKFLESIRDQARSRYGFKLSVKQQAALDKLLRKDKDMMGAPYG